MNHIIPEKRCLSQNGCHVAIAIVSLVAAFLARFDFDIPRDQLPLLYRGLLLAVPVKVVVLHAGRVDQGRWSFAGVPDLVRLVLATAVASCTFGTAARLLLPAFPRSIYFIDFLICLFLMAGLRLAGRMYSEIILRELSSRGAPVLIYGAGAAGIVLAREIQTNPALGLEVVGFLDDDPAKQRTILMGVPVAGTGQDARRVLRDFAARGTVVQKIIIAMPSATGRQMRSAVANCRAAGVECQTVPGIGELLSGKVLTKQLRNINVNDLLGREPVQLDEDRIRRSHAGRSVLVTGAAGSIGSELCRQIARIAPGRLVAFDQAESDLFKIDLELRNTFPSLDIAPEIGDIRDVRRVQEVMCRHGIQSVFHAAAYKHVPLMEMHPLEAARNNVLGTWNVMHAASKAGAQTFVLISSDKAVRPTSVMGTTKRIAELLVSSMPVPDGGKGTRFISVRFGNVLGSNGSVVPIFQAQIAAGGPVTITHPDMRRYFMTIPEAAQLVLQASTMGKGSELFVLDMGEPVHITTLAKHMIQLGGVDPDDIEIQYVGVRPGERLYEELVSDGEVVSATHHPKVNLLQGVTPPRREVEAWISQLRVLLEQADETAVKNHLRKLAIDYHAASPTRAPEFPTIAAAAQA